MKDLAKAKVRVSIKRVRTGCHSTKRRLIAVSLIIYSN